MISSVLSLRTCRVQYMSFTERYIMGVQKSKMKKGPTFAFFQKYVSSKNLPNEKPLNDSVMEEEDGRESPRGTGLLQKSRRVAKRSDMALCILICAFTQAWGTPTDGKAVCAKIA